jgi:hypothetical protein
MSLVKGEIMNKFFETVKHILECFALYNGAINQKDWIEENRYLRETLALERNRALSLEDQLYALQNNVLTLVEEVRKLSDMIVIDDENQEGDNSQ